MGLGGRTERAPRPNDPFRLIRPDQFICDLDLMYGWVCSDRRGHRMAKCSHTWAFFFWVGMSVFVRLGHIVVRGWPDMPGHDPKFTVARSKWTKTDSLSRPDGSAARWRCPYVLAM